MYIYTPYIHVYRTYSHPRPGLKQTGGARMYAYVYMNMCVHLHTYKSLYTLNG